MDSPGVPVAISAGPTGSRPSLTLTRSGYGSSRGKGASRRSIALGLTCDPANAGLSGSTPRVASKVVEVFGQVSPPVATRQPCFLSRDHLDPSRLSMSEYESFSSARHPAIDLLHEPGLGCLENKRAGPPLTTA